MEREALRKKAEEERRAASKQMVDEDETLQVIGKPKFAPPVKSNKQDAIGEILNKNLGAFEVIAPLLLQKKNQPIYGVSQCPQTPLVNTPSSNHVVRPPAFTPLDSSTDSQQPSTSAFSFSHHRDQDGVEGVKRNLNSTFGTLNGKRDKNKNHQSYGQRSPTTDERNNRISGGGGGGGKNDHRYRGGDYRRGEDRQSERKDRSGSTSSSSRRNDHRSDESSSNFDQRKSTATTTTTSTSKDEKKTSTDKSNYDHQSSKSDDTRSNASSKSGNGNKEKSTYSNRYDQRYQDKKTTTNGDRSDPSNVADQRPSSSAAVDRSSDNNNNNHNHRSSTSERSDRNSTNDHYRSASRKTNSDIHSLSSSLRRSTSRSPSKERTKRPEYQQNNSSSSQQSTTVQKREQSLAINHHEGKRNGQIQLRLEVRNKDSTNGFDSIPSTPSIEKMIKKVTGIVDAPPLSGIPSAHSTESPFSYPIKAVDEKVGKNPPSVEAETTTKKIREEDDVDQRSVNSSTNHRRDSVSESSSTQGNVGQGGRRTTLENDLQMTDSEGEDDDTSDSEGESDLSDKDSDVEPPKTDESSLVDSSNNTGKFRADSQSPVKDDQRPTSSHRSSISSFFESPMKPETKQEPANSWNMTKFSLSSFLNAMAPSESKTPSPPEPPSMCTNGPPSTSSQHLPNSPTMGKSSPLPEKSSRTTATVSSSKKDSSMSGKSSPLPSPRRTIQSKAAPERSRTDSRNSNYGNGKTLDSKQQHRSNFDAKTPDSNFGGDHSPASSRGAKPSPSKFGPRTPDTKSSTSKKEKSTNKRKHGDDGFTTSNGIIKNQSKVSLKNGKVHSDEVDIKKSSSSTSSVKRKEDGSKKKRASISPDGLLSSSSSSPSKKRSKLDARADDELLEYDEEIAKTSSSGKENSKWQNGLGGKSNSSKNFDYLIDGKVYRAEQILDEARLSPLLSPIHDFPPLEFVNGKPSLLCQIPLNMLERPPRPSNKKSNNNKPASISSSKISIASKDGSKKCENNASENNASLPSIAVEKKQSNFVETNKDMDEMPLLHRLDSQKRKSVTSAHPPTMPAAVVVKEEMSPPVKEKEKDKKMRTKGANPSSGPVQSAPTKVQTQAKKEKASRATKRKATTDECPPIDSPATKAPRLEQDAGATNLPPDAPTKPVRLEMDVSYEQQYQKKAKDVKHSADKTQTDKTLRILLYLESVVYFIMTGLCMEKIQSKKNKESSTPYTMIKTTVDLLKGVTLKYVGQNTSNSSISTYVSRVDVLSLRTQSLCYYKMFEMRQPQALNNYRQLNDFHKTHERTSTSSSSTNTTTTTTASSSSSNQQIANNQVQNNTNNQSSIAGGRQQQQNGIANNHHMDSASIHGENGNQSGVTPSPTPSPASSTGSSHSLPPGLVAIPQQIESLYKQQLQHLHSLMWAHQHWQQAEQRLAPSGEDKAFFDYLNGICGTLTVTSNLQDLCSYVLTAVEWMRKTYTSKSKLDR